MTRIELSTHIRAPRARCVERRDILSPPARALITALNAELSARYSEPGANHFRLDAEEVSRGEKG